MIDLIANFEQYQSKILSHIKSRVDGYVGSDCRKKLKNRYDRLRDSANLKIGHGQWKSKLVFPLVKEQQTLRRAITLNAFRQDPLYTLLPILETSIENAANMSMVCADNLKATEYRRKAWRPVVDFAAKFGTSVMYCSYYQSNKKQWETQLDDFGVSGRTQVDRQIQQVRHTPIHVLNYMQDPDALDCDESDFQAHIRRWTTSEMIDRIKSASKQYISENVMTVIKDARNGAVKDSNYYQENTADDGEGSSAVDVTHYWGTINIRGNEDDTTVYYVEMASDKILRCQADVYDKGLRPYCVFNFDKNYDYWWGNTDAENIIPHENFMNLQLSVIADALLLQNSSRLKFFNTSSGLKINDILNKATRDGWVGVDLQGGKLSDAIHQFEANPVRLDGSDFMLREVKESAQRNTSKPDLSRPSSMGGYNNSTATAANIIANMASITDSDYLESFSYGLMQQGKADTIILQQFLGQYIKARPSIKEAVRVLSKADILGDFSYQVKTSLEMNKQSEAMKKMQELTQLMNIVNSGNPAFQGVNLGRVVRDWIKSTDMGDVDEIFPEQMQQDNPIAVPSMNPNQIPQLPQETINVVA